MNLFLVLYRGSMDDVVVRGFYDEKDAEHYADVELGQYYRHTWKGSCRDHHPDVNEATDAYGGIDIGTYHSVMVLKVENGKPVSSKLFALADE